MSDKLKKIVFILLVSVFSIILIIKYSTSFLKNEILSIIKSDKFDKFILLMIDEKLEKIANSELDEEKKEFYQSNIKKILEKFKVD
tara:strand:+ start:452 stop:709 length:258 start_codon:yes stop_codon:yes gene_type:complete